MNKEDRFSIRRIVSRCLGNGEKFNKDEENREIEQIVN